MPLKTIKRKNLTDKINKSVDELEPGSFFLTAIRPTANNTLQVEVAQKRKLSGRKRTLIGLLNKSDKRFRDENTILYDWLKFEPKDFMAAFPSVAKKVSLEELQTIADSYDANADTGTNSLVYQLVHDVKGIVVPGEETPLEPIIRVTEVTETQLKNYEFFRGNDADEKIADELDQEYHVMKTSDDGEYILDPQSGDKIFRFTRTEFVDAESTDIIIPNKVTETVYKRMQKTVPGKTKSESKSAEELVDSIHGDDQL